MVKIFWTEVHFRVCLVMSSATVKKVFHNLSGIGCLGIKAVSCNGVAYS